MMTRLCVSFFLLLATSSSAAFQERSGTLLVANRTGGSISLFDLATGVLRSRHRRRDGARPQRTRNSPRGRGASGRAAGADRRIRAERCPRSRSGRHRCRRRAPRGTHRSRPEIQTPQHGLHAGWAARRRDEVEAGGFINSEPIIDGDRRLGYLVVQLRVQRELVPNLGLTVDYVGNRGRDQTALIDINEPRLLADGTFGRPGPDVFDPDGTLVPARARATEFGRVLQYQTRDDLNTDYNALEIGIDKRYSDRWSSRVS
jgi:hypothetical protein